MGQVSMGQGWIVEKGAMRKKARQKKGMAYHGQVEDGKWDGSEMEVDGN